jgi:gluconokinase
MSVLAVDVGSSSVRARVYDDEGNHCKRSDARRQYEVAHGDDGRAEFNAEELADHTIAAIEEARAEAHGDVEAVGMSCFWHGMMAIDRRGRAVSPVITWRDRRPAAAAAALKRALDGDAVYARTGCPLHPSFWPAKLAWLKKTKPQLFDSADRFVSFCDYLLGRLAGEVRTSVSMASGTGLLDVNDGRWDDELLAALQLSPERLAPVSDDAVGRAEPWFPALGDGACDNVGAGCTTRDRACLMVGTSAALRVVWEAESARPRPGLFLYRLDGGRFVEGGSLSDGGNLYAWLERTLRLPDGWTVGDREPDSHGLTFLPLLGGERSPGWREAATGAVVGLTLATDPIEVAHAALEGVAYRFAEILERMSGVREIVSTGHALAVNSGWLQIVADVLGRPVRVSAVDETSVRGAAVVALERLGRAPGQAPLGEVVSPRPERTDVYRAARERQRALIRALLRP